VFAAGERHSNIRTSQPSTPRPGVDDNRPNNPLDTSLPLVVNDGVGGQHDLLTLVATVGPAFGSLSNL